MELKFFRNKGFNLNVNLRALFCTGIVGVLLSAMAACFCASCSSDHEEPTVQSQPVIEGWINSSGEIRVYLTTTVAPGEEGTLADHLLRWAKVSVNDGENEVLLTGTPQSGYLPPYYYYGYMNVEPGRTYHIEAAFKEFYATAECMMPEEVNIKRIETSPVEQADSLVSAKVIFDCPDNLPAYYCLYMRKESGGQVFPCMMSAKEVTSADAGKEIEIPLFNPKTRFDFENYQPHLKRGQTLEVILCRITKEVYDYWYLYFDTILAGNNMFIGSATELPGNIIGGYGIWSARSEDRQLLDLQR